jgi:hypothetical protein
LPWRRLPSWALLVIALSSAIAADWPQFRGPAGLGRAPEGDSPAAWTDAENVVWRTELPGPGASSAIVVGKRVFVTCYSGYGLPGGKAEEADPERLRRHLLCLDHETGKIAWTREVAAPLPEEQYRSYQALHGYASSTPASDGERVYVFFGKAGVLAFDLEGKELWRESVGDRTHGWGSGTSPVLYGEHVIVNASVESGSLVALKKKDGKVAWTATGMTSSWNTPLVVEVNGRPETVVSVRGRLRAFHAATGEELWNCEGIPDYVCPSVIAADGIVYAIGARSNSSLAVRAGGKGDVTQSHVVWKLSRGSNVSSPVYHEGHLYWASESRGVVYCVDAKEGKVVYEERLQPSPDRIYASALVAGGKLYYVSRTEGTYVLEAKPAFKLLGRNAFAEDKSIFNATPAVSEGRLFLRSDRFLYCIGKKG